MSEKYSIANGEISPKKEKEIQDLEKLNIFDLSDRFIPAIAKHWVNFDEEMTKFFRILKRFNERFSKDSDAVKNGTRDQAIMQDKFEFNEKFLEELDKKLKGVHNLLTENMMQYMLNMKVIEAIIVTAKEEKGE